MLCIQLETKICNIPPVSTDTHTHTHTHTHAAYTHHTYPSYLFIAITWGHFPIVCVVVKCCLVRAVTEVTNVVTSGLAAALSGQTHIG